MINFNRNLLCRADTGIVGNPKFTGQDKAVLGYVWTMAVVYGLMSEQILSKEVNRPCSVREEIKSSISIISLIFGLNLPVLVGPVTVFIVHFVLYCLESVLVTGPGDVPKKEDVPSPVCILVLTIICLTTYTVSMVITEVYSHIYDNHFNFIYKQKQQEKIKGFLSQLK